MHETTIEIREAVATPLTPNMGSPKNPYRERAFPTTLIMLATIVTYKASFVYP